MPQKLKLLPGILVFILLVTILVPMQALAAGTDGLRDIYYNKSKATVSAIAFVRDYNDAFGPIYLYIYDSYTGNKLGNLIGEDKMTAYGTEDNEASFRFDDVGLLMSKPLDTVYLQFEYGDHVVSDVFPVSYDAKAPEWVANAKVNALDVTSNRMTLEWTPAFDASPVSYELYQDDTLLKAGVTGTRYDVSGLQSGTSYAFRIKARDQSGNVTDQSRSLSATIRTTGTGTGASGNANTGGTTQPGAGATDLSQVPKDGLINADALKKAFSANPAVQIKIQGEHAVLPVASLTEAAALSNSSVSIVSSEGSYTLPLSGLNLSNAAQVLGTTVAEMSVRVTIHKLTDKEVEPAFSAIEAAGGSALSEVVQFELVAQSHDGKSAPLSASSDRTIPVRGMSVNLPIIAGVSADAQSLRYVQGTVSHTSGTFQSTGNGIYTVIDMNKTFHDTNGHWAKNDIALLANLLLVNGTSNGGFEPDRTITRAEFAAMLVRTVGLRVSAPTSSNFADVDGKAWYADAVSTAAQIGIVGGYEDGTFRPLGVITREEMSAMMARLMVLMDIATSLSDAQKDAVLKPFADAGQIAWARNEIATVIHAGIVNGQSDTMLAPSAHATRAEAVVMLKRVFIAAGMLH